MLAADENRAFASSQWLNVANNPAFTKATIELTFNDDDASVSLLTSKQTSDDSTDTSSVTTIDMIDNDFSYWLDLDDECKDNLRRWSATSLGYHDLDNLFDDSSIAGMTLEHDDPEKKSEEMSNMTLEVDEQEKKTKKPTCMALKPEEQEKKAEKRTRKHGNKDEDDDFGSIFAEISLEDFEFERTKAIKSMGWTPTRRGNVVRSVVQVLQKSLPRHKSR